MGPGHGGAEASRLHLSRLVRVKLHPASLFLWQTSIPSFGMTQDFEKAKQVH